MVREAAYHISEEVPQVENHRQSLKMVVQQDFMTNSEVFEEGSFISHCEAL